MVALAGRELRAELGCVLVDASDAQIARAYAYTTRGRRETPRRGSSVFRVVGGSISVACRACAVLAVRRTGSCAPRASCVCAVCARVLSSVFCLLASRVLTVPLFFDLRVRAQFALLRENIKPKNKISAG